MRAALAPDYEVERELARGGMGIVFRAREVTLDRPVAIKIIRPELATARAAERFLREARILASMQHPNVVSVHKAGEADGFFYYVMEYIEGETLEDRLKRGPLPRDEALKLARDVLDALEAVHGRGVVHRDLKPSNIFLIDDRAVISDFGIAKPSDETIQSATTDGRVVGTVGYMSPEQAYGAAVTPASDLYSAAMVLFEAYTGRSWAPEMQKSRPDWSSVPGAIVPILRRALKFNVSERWPDATSLRRALWHTRTRKYRRQTLMLALGGIVAGGAAALFLVARLLQPQELTDVAILPFEPLPGVDSGMAANLTLLTRYNIESFATVADDDAVTNWWQEHGPFADSLDRGDIRTLRSRYAAYATVATVGSDLQLAMSVIDRDGRRRPAVTERLAADIALDRIGHRLGFVIASQIDENRASEYSGSPALRARSDAALNAFLDGLRTFKRGQFATATDQFTIARQEDPEFELAQWWFANAFRWLRTGELSGIDFQRLLATQEVKLPELERLLMAAQIAPTQAERYERYREAIERYPHNAYAAFLYAEELQARGPYVGVPLEQSTHQLELAAEKDPTFGPTQFHRILSYVRLGQHDDAVASLQRYREVWGGREEVGDLYQPLLMQFVITERFYPDSVAPLRQWVLRDSNLAASFRDFFRLGAMFDLARTQAELGDEFLTSSPASGRDTLAHLHEGRGLGLIGMGQIRAALSQLDSAAALFATPEARAEAAEWRVIGHALGLPGIDAGQLAQGVTELERLVGDSPVGMRAVWALGVHASRLGDTAMTSQRINTLRQPETDTDARRLANLLQTLDLAARGRYEYAVDASRALLPFDSAGRGGDPFARAVLHMRRAEWYDSLGQHAAADSARLWYEHFEWTGPPPNQVAQAGEIDWALSSYARWVRGMAAKDRGDDRSACRHLRRVLAVWSAADAAYTSLREQATQFIARSCPA
jgi:serine/threonine protein kinase